MNLISRALSEAGFIELGILYLLLFFSVASWALIFMKMRSLKAAKRNNARLLTLFNASESVGEFTPPVLTGPAPLTAVFNSAVDTLEKASHSGVRHIALSPEKLHEKVVLRMQHTAKDEMQLLRWGTSFLATAGSTTPFIGLLGTVWGIMATFVKLGENSTATLNVVGPSIASALIATAAGLAVAIPAVMFYNWIIAKIDLLQEEADTFIERMDFATRTEYADGPPVRKATSSNGEPTATAISEPFLGTRKS